MWNINIAIFSEQEMSYQTKMWPIMKEIKKYSKLKESLPTICVSQLKIWENNLEN